MSRQMKSMPASASTSVTSGDPMQFQDPIKVLCAASARRMRSRKLSHRPPLPALASHRVPERALFLVSQGR